MSLTIDRRTPERRTPPVPAPDPASPPLPVLPPAMREVRKGWWTSKERRVPASALEAADRSGTRPA